MVEMPRLDAARITAGLALTDPKTRKELWDIKAGRVDAQSLDEFKRLDGAGLLTHLFVRLCRDGKPGVVGASRDDVQRPGLHCTVCRKDALDHPIQESVTSSDLARELTDGSRWMIELSALSLLLAGVPRRSIRIPDTSRAPDPIDLAFMFDGSRYVCELKDREVNAADAGRFVGRAGALPRHRALIITTESVAGDALRVFERPSGGVSSAGPPRPRFIEDPDCVPNGLRWEMVFARLQDFADGVRLPGPGRLSLTRFPGLLASWCIMPHRPPRCTAVRTPRG